MLLAALAAATAASCLPDSGLEAICGPVASEDLVRVPGTGWLIASGLNIGSPARLYLVDSRSKQARPLVTDMNTAMQADPRGACPGPPDTQRMSLDGLNVRSPSEGPMLLLAANHGDRHAIELFRIDLRQRPTLTWVGCVPMPARTLANAVVPLADGGLLATSFHDPDDPAAWSRMDRGEPTGGVWEWHPGTGWKALLPGGVAGANGLETSADGRTLYVSAWAAGELLVIDRVTGSRRALRLDFRPDNIHRAADGSLLVAGQRAEVRRIAACRAACPQPWVVARIDAVSGAITPLASGPGSDAINYACGAIEVDGDLFITLRGAPRIAWTPLAGRVR